MIKINRNHLIQLIIIILSVWLIYTFVLSTIPVIRNIALKSFDTYSSLTADFIKPPKAINEITIITIDNETQNRMDLRWPWQRTFFVPILEKLKSYDPAVVYLSFFFHGTTHNDETTDLIFANSVKNSGNIVVPYIITKEKKPMFPYTLLKNAASGLGYTNKIRSSDGIIRKHKPVLKKHKSAEIAILNQQRSSSFHDNNLIPPLYTGAGLKEMYINCTIYPENFRTYNLIDLFNNKIPEDAIRDKIVLLGTTGDVIPNILNTPIGPMQGIYLIANTLIMYLSGSYIHEVNPISYNLFIILVLIIMGLAIFKLPPLRSLSIIILTGIITFISGYLLFCNGFFINFITIFFLLILLYIVAGFFRHVILLEEKVEALNIANIEIKNTQKELIRSEQLATIGRLTSQILHEFSNPMDNLKSCLGMLKNDIEKDHKLKRFIDISYNEITRMGDISKQLKSSYTPHLINLIPSHINKVILEVLDVAKYKIKDKNIVLKTDLDKSLNQINISKNKIKQVFFNILLNAIDALKDGGSIEVITGTNNGFQTIAFKDTGSGIPEESIPKLFNAFYTTKAAGEGSGLGLFLSYEIIKAHKGEIKVESKINEGTIITIKLPESLAST